MLQAAGRLRRPLGQPHRRRGRRGCVRRRWMGGIGVGHDCLEPVGVAVHIGNRTRRNGRSTEQAPRQHACIRRRDRLLVGLRRGDDHVQRIHGPGQRHVEQAQGLFHDALLVGLEHPLKLGRQNAAAAPWPGNGRPARSAPPVRATGDDLRRLAANGHVELGQHDDVELQTLGLVDRHHAHGGRRGVLDLLLPHQGHEIVGPQVARSS